MTYLGRFLPPTPTRCEVAKETNLRLSEVVLGGEELSWVTLLWLGYGVHRKLSRAIVIGVDMDSYFPVGLATSLVVVG